MKKRLGFTGVPEDENTWRFKMYKCKKCKLVMSKGSAAGKKTIYYPITKTGVKFPLTDPRKLAETRRSIYYKK